MGALRKTSSCGRPYVPVRTRHVPAAAATNQGSDGGRKPAGGITDLGSAGGPAGGNHGVNRGAAGGPIEAAKTKLVTKNQNHVPGASTPPAPGPNISVGVIGRKKNKTVIYYSSSTGPLRGEAI